MPETGLARVPRCPQVRQGVLTFQPNPLSGCQRRGTVAPVTRTEQTQDDEASTGWELPKYQKGDDAQWDLLGSNWQAVDGVYPGVRVYVVWQFDDDLQTRPAIAGLCIRSIEGGQVTRDALRAISVTRLENLAKNLDGFTGVVRDLPPLVREKDQDPEAFADRVAFYYRIFASNSSKPTRDLADHSGVPLPTMRGWIREARLRGKLPPGTRGKAG